MKKIIILAGFLGILGGSTTAVFAGYFNTTPVQRCDTQITNTLQIGSENNDVYVLQNMLSAGGYLFVQPNGYFGPSTKAAVKRFQSTNGLSTTGTVGELTRNAVNERLCDTDVRGESLLFNIYGTASGVTYVDQYDPYAIVISPKTTNPVVYATPQENVINTSSFSNNLGNTSYYPPATSQTQSAGIMYNPSLGYNLPKENVITTSSFSNNLGNSSYYPPVTSQSLSTNIINPATSQIQSLGATYNASNIITPVTSQIQSASIIYNPSVGYTLGIVPKSGSLTITSPVSNSIYLEGDTVNLVWSTSNMDATGFQVFLENTSTGQNRQVAFTRNMKTSFVLTKELLDAVCAGACDNNQQGSFKIVIATPVTDIAGITSNFRAAVSPIIIKRPYSVATVVTITSSTDPVNSGEKFKLYVNSSAINTWDTYTRENTTVKIHAICINNVQVSIAGVTCGQDFVMPLSVLASQSGIPTMITNPTWYKQGVVFEVTMFSPVGQVIGTSKATVNANPAPFSW